MDAKTDKSRGAVAGQVQRSVRPCAYRLRDAEASTRYGRDIYVFFAADEFHESEQARAAIATLAPLYDQAALDAALALWPRDCRLCAHYRDGLTHAAHCVSVLRCEDSSAYRATQPVQFWEKRPAEQSPF
jgi:hypothetical protein